jgi:hypothetical protein
MAAEMIRVDTEVYARVLAARQQLEVATGHKVPIYRALAFLVGLSQMGAATA